MAPEILNHEKTYNFKCDVYSYALVAYELITGKSPFYDKHIQSKNQIRKVILDKERPELSIVQHDCLKKFLLKCWSENPSARPPFYKIVDEILTDEFKKVFGINTEKSIQKIEDYLIFFYKVNTYKGIIFENNNFIYFSCSTVPQSIIDNFFYELKKLNFVKECISNVVHQNDPNSMYVFYFLQNFNYMLVQNILNEIFQKNNISFEMPQWNLDMFFDEKMISTDVLNIILNFLRTNKYVRKISRNIFDGRQIATYIYVEYDASKKINQALENFLIPNGLVFDKIKYPLENNIILNEKMILKKENDFDFIVNQFKKIKINPINIERNRLYLYGNYFIRKLFQTFSFICFSNENDKMKALNHINSIVYPDMKKVVRYKLNLHYGKIDDSAYPNIVRENLFRIFQSFKGFRDIQEHVFSIENPVERTYVGFDTLKHLRKSYDKFFHYVDILRYNINPKIFIKKKNLIYMMVEKKLSKNIEYIISEYFAIDTQTDCLEFFGNKYIRYFSKFINVSFFGFIDMDNYIKACNILQAHSFSSEIKYRKYHEFKTFLNRISDVPEEYLFYDSL
ncbi:hypothetical protein M9Y10_000301 [Tritrichomonas musculus]|uniref:Protein kinase domain-containing protein n=1 Tax=Tritrichomonas musculus TaxID=1915356 RepID=A0ABR2L4V1_9EUKA